MLSYFLNTRWNIFIARIGMSAISTTSTIATPRYISAINQLLVNASASAAMNMSGLLTAIRIIIMYAFCTLVTSVVRRVTSDDVEYVSMLPNEKS